jgi:ankyrin repeat protein
LKSRGETNRDSFETVDAAVFRKDYALLDELLKSVDVDGRDVDGRTPLMYAIVADNADPRMIEYLVAHGADVNATDKVKQWTPLHFASRDQKPEIVKILLERGAAADPVDAFGNTPLSYCITSTYPLKAAVVELLLAGGADPRRKNNHDSSPIDVARLQGRRDLLARLEKLHGSK